MQVDTTKINNNKYIYKQEPNTQDPSLREEGFHMRADYFNLDKSVLKTHF